MMRYDDFLNKKATIDKPSGITIDRDALNPQLLDFQKDIVRWALKRGRAAIFADCGLGKSFMQLEWAKHVPGDVLILAPLAVGPQTVREGEKFGIPCGFTQDGTKQGKITITNYQHIDKFDISSFTGVVLDESSILKSFTGSVRTQLIETFQQTPFRLACTATPSPNDFMELGNHSEFLGVMNYVEMLAMFFVHDGGDTSKWRLKGHAEQKFWQWCCQWAVMIRKPSDLGYSDDGFTLPGIDYKQLVIETENKGPYLFAMPAQDLQERIQARRDTVQARADVCANLVKTKPNESWIIWCNLDAEADAIRKSLPDAVEVRGSHKPEQKVSNLLGFSKGDIRILITKPTVAGFGMNWQHCNNMAFVGLSDSYEQYYQAVRRCWRFGQQKPVNVYVVTADVEGAVVDNIKRKEEDSQKMALEMTKNMAEYTKEELNATHQQKMDYKQSLKETDNYKAYLGDCVDVVSALPSDSIHYSIFSPPFASLYTYSNSDRDMGNCKTHDEFYEHFRFLTHELHRVIMPGRLISFHCMNLPTTKQRDGFIGIKDFRGNLVRMFEDAGFVFHSEVCIWKDPVTAMQRTKAIGLLHKQLKKDSALSRQGIPDYLVTMRKLGDNPEPVTHDNETFPVGIWQRYASPVWMDINPSDTLQYRAARDSADERHICPLQLQVIERGINLWTNPGDTVLSPFMGIASEGYVALKKGRKFIGSELKESYYNQAIINLNSAIEESKEGIIPGLEELLTR